MKSPKSQTQPRQDIFSQQSAPKSMEQTKVMEISAHSGAPQKLQRPPSIEMQIKTKTRRKQNMEKYAARQEAKTRREKSLKQTMRKAEKKFVAGTRSL